MIVCDGFGTTSNSVEHCLLKGMDFPPITRLVAATFDEMNPRKLVEASGFPRQEPKAVANAAAMGELEALRLNSAALSGSKRIGTAINILA